MPQCYVSTCSNYYSKMKKEDSKIIYHMVPKNPWFALKWARASGKAGVMPPPYARVCSDHFSSECYLRDLQHELLKLPLRRRLITGAVPDQNLPAPTEICNDRNRVLKEDLWALKNNKVNRLPVRSSVRIAKKKAIASLGDSVSDVNGRATGYVVPEWFCDKWKFMAKLQLRHEERPNEDVQSPCSNLDKQRNDSDTGR